MKKTRINSLQWGVGVLSTLLGAMILVVPHQFERHFYQMLLPYLTVGGFLFLSAGFALIGVSTLAQRGWTPSVVHVVNAALIGLLAVGLAIGGDIFGLIQFGTLSASLLLALPRLQHPQTPEDPRDRTDLLTLPLGVSALFHGLILLLAPGAINIATYGADREFYPLLGILLAAGGALVTAVQTAAFYPAHERPVLLTRRSVIWAAHLLTGLAFFLALIWIAVPFHHWLAFTYFGIAGLALWLLPWVKEQVPSSTPTTLRTRAAFILGITTAVPLILTVALVSNEIEENVQQDTLLRQQNQAVSLARVVEDYVSMHRAGLTALSRQPGLMDLPREEQTRLLSVYAMAYPDVTEISLYGAEGSLVASTVGLPDLVSAQGIPIFELARETLMPSLDIRLSPIKNDQVMEFGEPILDEGGRFQGLASFGLPTSQVAAFLQGQVSSREQVVYLVDERGRAISHPNPALVSEFQNLSSIPPVLKLFSSLEDWGYLTYRTGEQSILAGYAHLTGLNWGLVSERTTNSALAGVRAGRDLAFGILVFFLVLTTAGGIVLAGVFSLPLTALANAASEMASENPLAPIPTSPITEIQHLADSFHLMRVRLAARTSERAIAEAELRRAKQELENRVAERTEELINANQLLHEELNVRKEAEAALRESQELLFLSTEAAEIGYWQWDLVVHRLTWTERCKQLFGLPPDAEVTRETYLTLIHPDDRQLTEAAAEEALQRGTRYEREFRAIWPDGNTRWLIDIGRCIYAEDGAPLRMMGAIFDITERKNAQEAVRQGAIRTQLQHHLTQYREVERLRIAQDLHDGPLQELIAMNMSLSEIINDARETPFLERLHELHESLQTDIREMRVFCNELRPPALTPFGLEKAIRSHADTFTRTHPSVNVSMDLNPDGQLLSEAVRLAFFQIYKETLNNIIKHARASEVYVRLWMKVDEAILEIEDNGVGFQIPADWLELARNGHLGLVGARERAEAVGGQFVIQSVQEKGTLVRVVIPHTPPAGDANGIVVDQSTRSESRS